MTILASERFTAPTARFLERVPLSDWYSTFEDDLQCVSEDSGLIASHLGEAGSNLAKVFRYAESGPCVLFLGEFRRISNQLLILIDRLPGHCVLVCATNIRDQIDAAVMWRFDFKLTIPQPDAETRLSCAMKELARELPPGKDVSHLTGVIAHHEFPNLAELVQRCRAIRCDLVLNDGGNAERLASDMAGAVAVLDDAAVCKPE